MKPTCIYFKTNHYGSLIWLKCWTYLNGFLQGAYQLLNPCQFDTDSAVKNTVRPQDTQILAPGKKTVYLEIVHHKICKKQGNLCKIL